VATRATVFPQGILRTEPILPVLGPLSLEAARDTFYDLVGKRSTSSDPKDLNVLLQMIDMVPLTVTLMSGLTHQRCI